MPRSDFNCLTLGTRLASDLGRARQKCLSVPYGELAYVRLLQLQLGTPYNPLTLPFDKWGYLAPLLWVKVLWQSLDAFNIQFHMKYHPLPFPQERDQVIAEIILDGALSTAEIKSLSRCRGMLQCIFLSDLVTADGRYLEGFVFNPGPFKRRSTYCFPREGPT